MYSFASAALHLEIEDDSDIVGFLLPLAVRLYCGMRMLIVFLSLALAVSLPHDLALPFSMPAVQILLGTSGLSAFGRK